MTRETKIGLLVGLTVIVLIGVLMSDYLNKTPQEPQQANLVQTMGENFRQSQLEPGHVAAADWGSGAQAGATTAEPLVTTRTSRELPMAAGVEGGPRMEPPAVAQPWSGPPAAVSSAGQPAAAPAGGPSMVFVPSLPAAGITPRVSAPAAAAPSTPAASPAAGASYVVTRGDTLTKISRHFYGNATHANMERIVAANSRLKDIKTPLRAGETLLIPGVPAAAAAGTPTPTLTPEPQTPGRTIIGQPGHTRLRVAQVAAPVAPPAHAVAAPTETTYTVQRGDTLASIAKRLLGSSSHATVAKLAAANGIKDVNTVRVGQVLRIK